MVRPVKAADDRATVTLGLRVTGRLKNALEAAAQAADRTLSSEAERRLRRSLDRHAMLEDTLAALRGSGCVALDNALTTVDRILKGAGAAVGEPVGEPKTARPNNSKRYQRAR